MRKVVIAVVVLVGIGSVALMFAPPSGPKLDPAQAAQLQRLRNLGKAFYENPGTQMQAVDELRKALELNPGSAREHLNYGLSLLRVGKPEEGIAEIEKAREIDRSIPHTYFNLGIEFKRLGEADRAIREFKEMLRLVPDEPKSHYNLGVLYRLKKDTDKAIGAFERASELDPSLAAPNFQLYNVLRRIDAERAKQKLDRFRQLKDLQAGAAIGEDINWSFYSELYDPIDAAPPATEAATTEFRAVALTLGLKGSPIGLTLLEVNGDGAVDLAAWSRQGVAFDLSDGLTPTKEVEGGIRSLAAGDFNNDGFQDICLITGDGVYLGEVREGLVSGDPRLLSRGDFQSALWVDYDHDYDLDLLVVGGQQILLRNNGDGTFKDVSDKFPFVKGSRGLAAATLELWENNGFNIVVVYADKVVVYEDRKVGEFRAKPIPGVQPVDDRVRLDVVDLDNDGFLDIAMSWGEGTGTHTRILRNHEGQLRAGSGMPGVLAWGDFQNRGWVDAITPDGLLLNRGGMKFESGQVSGLPDGLVAAVAADFDGSGSIELAALDDGGSAYLLSNATESTNKHVSVFLKGVKNNVLAEGARVEVKAGRLYRKQVYQGVPLTFGLAGAESIDTVRITWANGLIQNESQQAVGQAHVYEEKPRLSGSCPMIFTWNGREFEFISEVLAVAPLGTSLGEGKFFPVDHDEYVSIAGSALRPRDGFYEIRITEELREVAYIDQVKLIAVDHPSEVDIFSSEKFKGPPFPEFRLYGVTERYYPQRAVDHHAHDVRERLLKRDRRYADDFERDFAGRAEHHSLTLDFPSLRGRDDVVLFLHGWVDWADASILVASGQSKLSAMQLPSLQVRDAQGNWVTVVADMGLPAGRPRTIAVDLRGKFLSDSREVRILTNMCLYWDEVFAAVDTRSPEATLTPLLPQEAELRFRGFSDLKLHPQRKQPERYDYARVHLTSMWNPTPGMYTRYGEVPELLEAIDDRFVILGAGDELALRFPATGLPDLPPGWRRDFLLFADGWAKENEANTAFGDSVEPLPFHAMTGYPYGPSEHYPDENPHRRYLREYNVRGALRLIRPLR